MQTINLLSMNGTFLISSLLNTGNCNAKLERIVEMNVAGTLTLNKVYLMQSKLPWKQNIQ